MARHGREVSSAIRLRTLQRDRFTCVYCGVTGIDAELHVDHRIPKAAGGSNHISNLATACASCNLSKGAKPEPLRSGCSTEDDMSVGRVVALGMADGECPVGKIVSVSMRWVKLSLMSFIDGFFGYAERSYRRARIEQVQVARMLTKDEAQEHGGFIILPSDPPEMQFFDTIPLGQFQTDWKRARRRGGES